MRLVTSALAVARLESALFHHFPKLRLSVLGITLIPALYAFIYLMSVWDPASRTSELPAAIVNLDQGTQANGQAVNVGADLTLQLKEKKAFGFVEVADAEQAKSDVRQGKTLFALIIPADFSQKALSASEPGVGKVVVYASEGNNYAGAGMAKRFAAELAHQVNETLNEKRWTVVLGTAASSSDSLTRLRAGVDKLLVGARQLDGGMHLAHQNTGKLADGSAKLSDNVTAMAEGVKQLSGGAQALQAKSPPAADLQALKSGAAQLATAQTEMQRGLGQLEDGALKLSSGAVQLRDQSKAIPLVGAKVGAGASQLSDGAAQLHSGLRTANDNQAKLATSTQSLSKGVDQMTDGFAAYSAGVGVLASRFPPDAKLDELAGGGATLAHAVKQLDTGMAQLGAGAGQLVLGLDTLATSLPSGATGLTGSASGLANSVEPQIEIDAPVQNNGMGFAPNFIPVALWLGAVMTAFIFHLRRLPAAAQTHSPVALLMGKMTVLGSINLMQTVCVLLMSAFLLGIQPAHLGGLALTMVVASWTFMLIILGLVRVFGDAGKAVALILLILQLSAAGGTMPIELTNDFFRAVSPWVPFTWAVKAVRASAFGAYGSDWGTALAVLLAFATAAFLVATYVGKWKFVSPAEHRPAMDI
ncbi:MAG: YhgE/Pip domain-containing protein [Burkholderiales bacterium]|nr:YhgE/Pip domain-containing protein [Burkholderiales bacterium]